MTRIGVRAAAEAFPLARPFRISRGVKTVAEVVAVELSRDGKRGRGEAVPYARYGETIDSVLAQIASIEADLAAGQSRDELLLRLPAGAARNAVDCALWDLEASHGEPVAARVGWPSSPIATAMTVSLDDPGAMAAAAAELDGLPLIKVKVDRGDPATCLREVRAAAPRPAMIVDPNESWDMATLERLQPLLAELRVAFVEQPLPADADAALAGFAPPVPICADESCHTADDLDRLTGRYGIVNIKLDKTGGLTEALRLLAAARERDFGVMVGCMISSSLSIAPAMYVAAQADFADLDGPLWLREDRAGGVVLQDGRLIPPQPGFWGSPPSPWLAG